MKHFITVLILVCATTAAFAEGEITLSSNAPKVSKSQIIRDYANDCFSHEVALFESKRGRLPSDDEADFIIDTCVNPKFK